MKKRLLLSAAVASLTLGVAMEEASAQVRQPAVPTPAAYLQNASGAEIAVDRRRGVPRTIRTLNRAQPGAVSTFIQTRGSVKQTRTMLRNIGTFEASYTPNQSLFGGASGAVVGNLIGSAFGAALPALTSTLFGTPQ